MSIGKKIKQLRQINGLTQQELADQLFVQRQTISNWETSKTVPKKEDIQAIETYFNLSLNDVEQATLSTKKSETTFAKSSTNDERDTPSKTGAHLLITSIIGLFLFPIGPILSGWTLTRNKRDYTLFWVTTIVSTIVLFLSSLLTLFFVLILFSWVDEPDSQEIEYGVEIIEETDEGDDADFIDEE
jgi:transcriptional regulator with XRE-family HTH domain